MSDPRPSPPAITAPPADALTVRPVAGLPELAAGDDLAALLAGACPELQNGDVLVVTSKVVSKAEGRVVAGDRGDLLAGQTERVVARRGGTAIVRTSQGLVLAAAGIDGSNTEPGTAVLLPEEPDRSARQLREALHANSGRNVAVVVSDTAGRAWREGQTDQ
ncbi:MAG TPA: coenzyme F420-0:L-glutamate ligase, partial [Nocardioidaceae bacterium]|nr:coenzyme F420-0:L-glutamate ligase [Nocardioidaceae bacterium]